MEVAGWVATCVGMGDWSMNDREALGDCNLAGVDEKTETLPELLLFAAIESKSSDALIRSVSYQLFSQNSTEHTILLQPVSPDPNIPW